MIDHPRLIWIGVVLSSVLLTPPIGSAEDSAGLLATVREGNRAAILAITSMQCRYDRRPWGDTTPEQADKNFFSFSPGRFWRSGETYRILKPIHDGTTQDNVVRNGQGLFLRKGGPLPRPYLTFGTMRPVDGVGGDMWRWLLFSHWGRNPLGFYPLADILECPYILHKAERLPPPANTIHIELSQTGERLEFWFDPKVNYLIRKRISIAPVPTHRCEEEVIEFAEPAPAVFVPTIIEHRRLIDGKLQAVIRTFLSDLKVNQPLAANALCIPGIAGMDCVDLDRDMKYKVDADGNRVGPESPVSVGRVSGPARMGGGGFLSSPESTSSFPQPSKPPMPVWKWILMVSVFVLVAALILAIVRRRRQVVQLKT